MLTLTGALALPHILSTSSLAALTFIIFLPYLIEELDDPIGVAQFKLGPDQLLQSYDFIVIGAGSAGSVVAARLSEDYSKSVLLLEAGGDGTVLSNIPFVPALAVDPDIDWKYLTEPDGRACLGMKGKRCEWHRGKALGGTSVINGMLYVRGNKQDYDDWERRGNVGWNYEDVLPFFKKSEGQLDPHFARDRRFHGTNGPQPVSSITYRTKAGKAFLQGGEYLGYSVIKDLNGPNQYGFAASQANIRQGNRYSSARSYLTKASKRQNLHILPLAHVTKIHVDKGRAWAVSFRYQLQTRTVYCQKEVILSAGAIASPQILMLSGIGPREHLSEMGIKTKVHLPGVGSNLQSHVGTGEMIFSTENENFAFPSSALANPSTYLNYLLKNSGPLSSPSLFETLAFIRTGISKEAWPDVELQMMSSHVAVDDGLIYRDVVGLSDASFNRIHREMKNKPGGFTIIPFLLHPKSRGKVKLRSRNPLKPPRIYTNYLSDPEDVYTLTRAINITLALTQTPPFQHNGVSHLREPNPYCTHLTFHSDPYWECAMRHLTYPVYHDVGTCKMGPDSDPEAVVDPRLRVHGIKNLRVADASIMPTHISGNTNTPVQMIGERVAHFIKHDSSDVTN